MAMKWDAELYDDKHAFVYQYGESLVDLLEVKPGEHILDLGCGTGPLTAEIKHQGAIVAGMDASAEMIARALHEYPEIDFSVGDASHFQFDEPFDAVFSNAALHWIHKADEVIGCVYNNLKPGGRFVGEMGGKGNMKWMLDAAHNVLQQHGFGYLGIKKFWYFPSLAEYAAKLESGGFRVTFAVHFDRPTQLQDGAAGVSKWLNMFGPSFFEGMAESEKEQILSEITSLLRPHYERDGSWYADYVRLRFIAVKES
jgi:trans-aconitate methyltransferase